MTISCLRSLFLLLLFVASFVQDACARNASDPALRITGDYLKRKEHGNVLIAVENAVAQIADQDAKLEADMIAFDKRTQIIEATGHVRITRNSTVTSGSKFRFKADSNHYLVTDPGVHVKGFSAGRSDSE